MATTTGALGLTIVSEYDDADIGVISTNFTKIDEWADGVQQDIPEMQKSIEKLSVMATEDEIAALFSDAD